MSNNHGARTCQICKLEKRRSELFPAALVRDSIADTIKKSFPEWSADGWICKDDHNRFRALFIRNLLSDEQGELDTLERDVIKSFEDQETISRNVNEDFEGRLSIGQRMADRIATFGGSWNFIGIFTMILMVWIGINVTSIMTKPVDPYPFMLLNLVLSCIAALQAPVIMMSQNRQESKDRLRAEHDYRINLKAELEIRHLNERLDHLVSHQWERLLEIQQIQMEMMQEIGRLRGK